MEFFNRTATDALAVGLTSVHDAMSAPEEINFYRKCVQTFPLYPGLMSSRLSETQKLPVSFSFARVQLFVDLSTCVLAPTLSHGQREL
jgi:hypothetical protein